MRKIDPRFTQETGTAVFSGSELLVKGALETEGGVHLLTGYPGSPIAPFFDTLEALGPMLDAKGIVAKQATNEALAVAMVPALAPDPPSVRHEFREIGRASCRERV